MMKKIFFYLLIVFLCFPLLSQGFSEINIQGDYSTEDAKIYLNGIFHGYAPKRISDLLPGIYNLRLEKDDYEIHTEFIELIENEFLRKDIILKKIYIETDEKEDNGTKQ